MGALAVGVPLFLLVRWLRRQRQKGLGHAGVLNFAEGAPPDSRRYEKPELTGEDARKETDAEERRKAELMGQDARTEMEATPPEHTIAHKLYS